MQQVTLEKAAQQLPSLVEAVLRGEEVIILMGDRSSIKLIVNDPLKLRPKFGSAKGLVWMSDDFDEPLEEMKEYME